MGAVSQLWSLGAELRFDPTCSTWGTFQSQFHTVDKTCWSIFLHKEHRRTQKQVNFCSMASMGLSELLLFSALYAEVWPSASVQVTLRGAPRTLTNCDRCSLENRHPARQSLLICLRLLGRNFDLLIYATCRASKASPSHLPTAGSYLESRNSFMVFWEKQAALQKKGNGSNIQISNVHEEPCEFVYERNEGPLPSAIGYDQHTICIYVYINTYMMYLHYIYMHMIYAPYMYLNHICICMHIHAVTYVLQYLNCVCRATVPVWRRGFQQLHITATITYKTWIVDPLTHNPCICIETEIFWSTLEYQWGKLHRRLADRINLAILLHLDLNVTLPYWLWQSPS